MFLHVFRHIDADHRLLRSENSLRKRLGQLRFSHTGWTKEQERTDRTIWIFQSYSASADRAGYRLDCLVLSDDPFVKDLLQLCQPSGFLLRKLLHRDLRPGRYRSRNVLLRHRQFSVAAPFFKTCPGCFQLLFHLSLLFLNSACLLEISVFNRLLFFFQKPFVFFLIFLQRFRNLETAELYPRCRFIHQVNGFVRQKAVVDIAGAHLHRCIQRSVTDLHAMVALIVRAHSFEDLLCLFLCRLFHGHRLETAFQRRIFFNIFPVFFQGRRSDQLDLASGERRFQNIRRIQSALGSARSNDRMQLINKEKYIFIFHDFPHNVLDPLLKFTAVLAARDHS